MTAPGEWNARIELTRPDAEDARRLYRVLLPEASREVPRARAELPEPVGRTLRIEIVTKDTGALRAAVQTYLGWVKLVDAAGAAGTGRA